MGNIQTVNEFAKKVKADWPKFFHRDEANEVAKLTSKGRGKEAGSQVVVMAVMRQVAPWCLAVQNETLGKVKGKIPNPTYQKIRQELNIMGLKVGTTDIVVAAPGGVTFWVEMKLRIVLLPCWLPLVVVEGVTIETGTSKDFWNG